MSDTLRLPAYAELQTTTNFSFLRGGSHPDELVRRAKALGHRALGICDRNTLAGVVRGHVAAKEAGLPFRVGCRLELADGPDLICYPMNRKAYGRLSRLLSDGKRTVAKGECHLTLDAVAAQSDDQIFIAVPPGYISHDFGQTLAALRERLNGPLYTAAAYLYRDDDHQRIAHLARLGDEAGVPLVATNDVHYHVPDRRPLQDVLTSIREHSTLEQAGYLLAGNAERYLKSPEEMARLFKGHTDAVARTMDIIDACHFSLDELRYHYPREHVPDGQSPQEHLEVLTWQGARQRFPDGIPGDILRTLSKELKLIAKLRYAPYFLTVHDIVSWAREQDILCQGRGSAANSAVCYCLHITSVDPREIDLLFDRFVSEKRGEPPDIDVDFEHERREEVIQYIYERYGRERAGIAATVISYRARSAVREVGKVMGLSEDVTSALSGMVWGWSDKNIAEKRVREAGLDPHDPLLARTMTLSAELMGFPRHLSQHVGGFVLTEDPLVEVVPVGNAAMPERTFVEWDKDDLSALNILKIDVLSLGMLTCLRKCFELTEAYYDVPLTLASVPKKDVATYDMLCRADTIGVFQIESRAQMSMLPRLKPRKFYDLVIEIAIVRPGPIQGDMVHPYLRRRDGIEPVYYPEPHPEHGDANELKRILEKTLGVPLFQEQAMRIAIDAAKFSPDEANELRHAMATFRRRGTIETLEEKMVGRMIERGYDPDFAKRCFDQIKGFGEYGFPESHSASFALLAYASSWLKCHYPAVFACALLNSQPMGFYAPAQIVRDAREHDVEVRPVDINLSDWDNTLEPIEPRGRAYALRLGMRQVGGLNKKHAEAIVDARGTSCETVELYETIEALRIRAHVPVATLQRLAEADAFRSIGLDRRQALWNVRGLSRSEALPLFAHAEVQEYGGEDMPQLPEMRLSEHVIADYQTLRLSLKAHPMALLRKLFEEKNAVPAQALKTMPDGARTTVAGVILVRQRPGTAKGVIFMTIEDETGVANAVIWPNMLERYRKIVMGSRLILIRGRIQSHSGVIHLVAERLEDHTSKLRALSETNADTPLACADAVAKQVNKGQVNKGQVNKGQVNKGPMNEGRVNEQYVRSHPRDVRIVPRSRDFH